MTSVFTSSEYVKKIEFKPMYTIESRYVKIGLLEISVKTCLNLGAFYHTFLEIGYVEISGVFFNPK